MTFSYFLEVANLQEILDDTIRLRKARKLKKNLVRENVNASEDKNAPSKKVSHHIVPFNPLAVSHA